jgi:hypothetical protein
LLVGDAGITPIIDFIANTYDVRYAPNTRETIRDEAVKYFVAFGMVVRNPDNETRPTNSGRTVYQIERIALELFRAFGTAQWGKCLEKYLESRQSVNFELARARSIVRVPLRMPDGSTLTMSPGGQNPLIKKVIEEFCPRFTPNGVVLYVGDAEVKHGTFNVGQLNRLGVIIDTTSKMPDVVVHHVEKNWLVLVEAVTSAGPVDGKRRSELKSLFGNSSTGLVFVTAFTSRRAMRGFLTQISWETEVWVAEDPDHLIHFNGERFLGPYPDAMPS